MRAAFLRISDWLDTLTRAVGIVAGLLLVATVLTIVVLRYGFGTGSIKLQDLSSYAFAVFVILALPVCQVRRGHVRVEVLTERLSQRYRIWADRVALAVFLIPVFGLLIWAYWPDLVYSWQIRESSLETGGLAGLFLVKTALPLAAVLMIVQGIAQVLRPPDGADGDGS